MTLFLRRMTSGKPCPVLLVSHIWWQDEGVSGELIKHAACSHRRPWVFVRLKEPTFQQELLRQVVATANRHRALQFLVLVFESAEEVEAVRDMGLWQGKIMRAFPVRSHLCFQYPLYGTAA